MASGSRYNVAMMAATIFGAVFSLFGTFMYCLWPSIFDSILNSKLVLTPGSASYDLWEVTPIPMYIEFYLFNWTNPEDINNPNRTIAKPKLVELGPYVYREHREKVIKQWNDENSTITFYQNRTWFYVPERSNGSLDDLITTINVPAVTAAYALRDASFIYKGMLELMFNTLHTKVHVTKTARQFLFDGYSDTLLNLASIVPASVVPVHIPFDKFGWFYARNGSATYDGLFNMYTGVDDISKFGQIGEWNYYNHTPFYKDHCGAVRGSAGEFFPPNQKKTDITLFSSDVCRTLTLSYKEHTTFDGVAGYRYWGDDTMFDNTTTRPENWCFCPNECPPSGTIDVSSCKFGAPAFISFPHFYHADPSYREAVEGMHPNASKHQLFVDIEPRSGIPLQVSAAMQINMLLQPTNDYNFLKHVPKVYFPCIWFKQTAQMDETMGPTVRLVSRLPSIGSIVSLVMLSTGLSVIAILAICVVTRMCRKEEDAVVLNTSPSPIPTSAQSTRSRKSFRATSAEKAKYMKSLLHAYFWRQKVIPSESVIKVSHGNALVKDAAGMYGSGISNASRINIHSVVIPPLSLSSSECGYDLVQNAIRSRRSSQISTKGEEMAPLCIDQDLGSSVAAYM